MTDVINGCDKDGYVGTVLSVFHPRSNKVALQSYNKCLVLRGCWGMAMQFIPVEFREPTEEEKEEPSAEVAHKAAARVACEQRERSKTTFGARIPTSILRRARDK